MIRSVLIVGGGSSGWMTAALLNRRAPELRVTLIEASDIPTLGVGESTNPVIKYFNKLAGVEEKPFMRATNGAFKLAIRFENFNRPGAVFFHPFGQPRRLEKTLFRPNAERDHASFHLATAPDNPFSPDIPYSYQVDAGLYGQYLKELSRSRGVNHVVDRVRDVVMAPDGSIAHIATNNSGLLTADLYVDCTGFRAALIDKAMHEPFESVSSYLLNDRAVAARIPYIDKRVELTTYTNCTALSAGWVWNIPLWSRIGLGYVYCSEHCSQAAAEQELRQHIGEARADGVTFNHIEIRAGRHARAWVRNCVAIGPAYGFLEPLESTGLSLTQAAIIDLAREVKDGSDAARARFNARHGEMFDATRDFVLAHFALTQRDDTPYWRRVRSLILPVSLQAILDEAKRGSYETVDGQVNKFYEKLNWNLILSGMDFFTGESSGTATPTLPRTVNVSDLLRMAVHEDEYSTEPEAVDVSEDTEHPMWAPTW